MKKILGISLCALFAVSAANAEIASKSYVDQQVGAIDLGGIATNAAAIEGLDGRVTQNETDIDSLQATAQGLGDLATKDAVTNAEITDNTIKNADIATDAAIATSKIAFSTQQTAALNSGITSESVNKIDANADAISENAGDITALTTRVGTNETNIGNNTQAITALQGSVGALGDLASKDSVATGDIDDGAIMNADINDSAAIATTKIAFTDGQKNALNSGITSTLVTQIGTNETNIANNTDGIAANETAITALTTRVGTNETNIGNNTQAITALQGSVGALGDLASKDSVATGDIDDGTITNADISTTAGIATSKIAFSTQQSAALNSGIDSTKVAQIATNATSIGTNARNITDMGTQVTANKESITTLTTGLETANQKIQNNATAINANTASINSILNATGIEACNTSAGCTLVHDSNGFKWEEVKR